MFAGHFGLAALIKAKEPNVPLWAIMLSTQLMDVIFVPFLLFGIESFEPLGNAGYGEQLIHADYTHSLLGAGLIALIAGLIAKKYWGKNGGIVIGITVFSHWILDLIVHRMDMPILPANYGNFPLLGFGLWAHPQISILIEGIIIIIGAIMYSRYALEKGGSKNKTKAMQSSLILALILAASLIISVLGY